MKKGFFITIITLVGLLLSVTACQDELQTMEGNQVPEGYTQISFTAAAPAMSPVAVRAVDPDGVDIQNLILLCFNEYGLFISTVQADLDKATTVPSISGKYKAVIPEGTYIIHFLANQNPEILTEQSFANKSEDEVQSEMVGASGMILYWARFVRKPAGTLNEQLAAENNGVGIQLIRNQAKVTVEVAENVGFQVTGFVTTNIHAFGTTAPYHPTKRFPTPGTTFEWPGDEDFVTLPENLVMMSDIDEVNTKPEDYIYEHENTLSNPVSVIIRGKRTGDEEELYYRVMIVDEDGEQLMIRRNHHYKIIITGELSYGQKTFAEALKAPATNNVWVAVDNWVNEITEGDYTLTVDQTSVVLPESKKNQSYTFTYTIKSTGEDLTEADKASVMWEEGNNVAANSTNHSFTIASDGKSATGQITIQLLDMTNNNQRGTLVVKHGRLQRTIQVYMIRTQKFTPSWVGTQIYGGETGQFVTMKFTIPEECPDVLYPFPVLISVNSLDVRSSASVDLPVLTEGEEGYFGIDNGIGYKYVYTVEKPGVQRIYFKNILTHGDGQTDEITIEADFFEALTKEFAFVSHQKAIEAKEMKTYQLAGNQEEEQIYYYLLPKKVNAPFDLKIGLKNKADNTEISAGNNDEFILYTKTLDATDGDDCDFIEDYSGHEHDINGRVLPFVLKDPAGNKTNYILKMKTNRAVADDLVRISSNSKDEPSIVPGNNGAEYNGESYRSFIFELGTYRPFGFAAQIAVNDGGKQGNWNYSEDITSSHVEEVTPISLSYEPSQKVDIYLDVTSFLSSDGNSIDPFGTAFEIYIDAEMLTIDEERLDDCKLNANKLKVDPTNPNRFIYTVDADRITERGFSSAVAAHGDQQSLNERKKLPFRTRTVTSAGEIRISSQKDKVVFYDKVFELSNNLIAGLIQYNDGTTDQNVPKDAFVSFSVKNTGVRIGSINITADGCFELNLRKEYEFDWENDAVEMDYVLNDKVYSKEFNSLKELYKHVVTDNSIVVLNGQVTVTD